MLYRRLGNSGLQVSALSYGSWVTFGKNNGLDNMIGCLEAARAAGINFFDCAESYAKGDAEQILGEAIGELGWKRHSYVISTKFFMGLHDEINMRRTLNRKYLLQAIDGSLERLDHDFVDLIFCHRLDPETPIEEIVWAMSDIIASGRALYWGTSEWPSAAIRSAHEIASRHHLRPPVMEQPEYSLITRERVEVEYESLYRDFGLGLTTWSPLAGGVLSGKYLDRIPADSRITKTEMGRIKTRVGDEALKKSLRALEPIAHRLDCSLAQLALAWCLKNKRVSTVITGASRIEQIEENVGALDVMDRLDEEIMTTIDGLFPQSNNFAH